MTELVLFPYNPPILEEIAYYPDAATARLRPAARHREPGEGEAVVRVLRVGFCGTDREIVRGGIGALPDGASSMVLGHEMVGELAAPAPGVRAGTLVVPTVRRGCGSCAPCVADRSDFCLTGRYTEHGITRADGFATPFVVLPVPQLVEVPPEVGLLAVLAEPLSIVEKALDQARVVLGRVPGLEVDADAWGTGRRALVAGAGPIGLLAVYLLHERGFDVEVIDLRPDDSLSATIATAAGAEYVRVAGDRPALAAARPPADVVIEATGDPLLAFELLGALGPAGVLVWLGVGPPHRQASFDVGAALLAAVLNHHAVVASINSSRAHFERALRDLDVLRARPGFERLVTAVLPPERFEEAIWPGGEAIKQVVAFAPDPGGTAGSSDGPAKSV